MSEHLEKLIRESLETEKPPQLSPFFPSRVINQIKLNREEIRFTRPILIGGWCLSSFFIVLLLTNFVWSRWLIMLLLTLVPISFFLTLFHSATSD